SRARKANRISCRKGVGTRGGIGEVMAATCRENRVSLEPWLGRSPSNRLDRCWLGGPINDRSLAQSNHTERKRRPSLLRFSGYPSLGGRNRTIVHRGKQRFQPSCPGAPARWKDSFQSRLWPRKRT